MEKFEGNGAECMVKFIAGGCKGHIQVNDGSMVFGETAWRKQGLWQLDWLDKSCAYFPPEPQWVECSPGEALDALVSGKQVQLKLIGYKPEFEWADVQHDNKSIATSVCWSPSGKYRKEL